MGLVKPAALTGFLICLMGGCSATKTPHVTRNEERVDSAMQLGNFSVSLAVKDIAASRAFYEKLGFTMVGGDQSKN